MFRSLVLQFCWRENIRDNKKNIAFLIVWDKDSYTERWIATQRDSLCCFHAQVYYNPH
jgi:hypothetical protein